MSPRVLAKALTDKKWKTEVHDPFTALVRTTLPQLSAWGPALSAQFFGCLVLGILAIPLTIATEGNPVSATLIFMIFVPMINLYGPATVSTRCDTMQERLNEIRVEENEAAYEGGNSRVFRLIEYVKDFNKGQGLGFVIFGQTVNQRVLLGFFGAFIAIASLFAKMITVLGAGSTEERLEEIDREIEVLTQEMGVLIGSNASATGSAGG